MKTKKTRWVKDEEGKPVLEEYWVDEGPSYASGVTRGRPSTSGKHRRSNGRSRLPAGMSEIKITSQIPRGNVHPGDTDPERWQTAVGISKNKDRKIRDSGGTPLILKKNP